ncbi:MAG TPA: hypothetical protein VGK19_22445 [Capsulimonadaceae bacterium]
MKACTWAIIAVFAVTLAISTSSGQVKPREGRQLQVQRETAKSVVIRQSFSPDPKLSRLRLPTNVTGVPVLQSSDSITGIAAWAEKFFPTGPSFHSIGETSDLFLVVGSNYSGVNRYDSYLFLRCYVKHTSGLNPSWIPIWKLVHVDLGVGNNSSAPPIAYGAFKTARSRVTLYNNSKRKVKTIDMRDTIMTLRMEGLNIPTN